MGASRPPLGVRVRGAVARYSLLATRFSLLAARDRLQITDYRLRITDHGLQVEGGQGRGSKKIDQENRIDQSDAIAEFGPGTARHKKTRRLEFLQGPPGTISCRKDSPFDENVRVKYAEFERVISRARMNRYLYAAGNSRKAMTLYRLNLRLSQEFFTVISCLEVSLRNRIDEHYYALRGSDWLRDSARNSGFLSQPNCGITPRIINSALARLAVYSHAKLIAEMDFGFWRYLFARHQFFAGGQTLLEIFPGRPSSTPQQQYNHSYVFAQLEKINMLRNRLAHHEPICFANGATVKDTTYARHHYEKILDLFRWMSINEKSLLYGLDHIEEVADQIDSL